MVNIIILTWNGEKYLDKLFSSLQNLDFPQDKFKILVYDSGSTDGTKEKLLKLKKNINNLEITFLEKNFGFAGGNNFALKKSLQEKADYVLLLNQDIVIEPDILTKLVTTAKQNPQIGIVQPLIKNYNNREEIDSWGNEIHYLGFGWAGGNHQTKIDKNFTHEIITASGAAVLYSCAMLHKIGLFDEKYFSYHEDSDICLRAKLAGYKILIDPSAVCYHDHHFPTTKNKERYFWMEKNRLYLILKFYKFKTLFLIWPMLFMMDLGQLIFATKNGFTKQFIRSRLWPISHLPQILIARRKIQISRLKTDKELMHNFKSEILFQDVSNPLLDKIANPIMKFYWNIIKHLI
jgi:GT2 family glycosyltransferase